MPSISNILNPNSFQDKRVFILCGGPSLRGFDYTTLLGEIVIGINKSFAAFPNTAFNFSLDKSFLNVIYRDKDLLEKWKAYDGIKIFASRKKSEKFSKDIFTILTWKKYKREVGFISLDIEKGIFCGNNSGFAALMFAISCGCKQIYFLGLDLQLGKNGETHHHSGYEHQKLLRFEDKLEEFKQQFMRFEPKIKRLGIKVTNLNEQSALRCFEFNTLENIL